MFARITSDCGIKVSQPQQRRPKEPRTAGGAPPQVLPLRCSPSGAPPQGLPLRGSASGAPPQGLRLRCSPSGAPPQVLPLRCSASGAPPQGPAHGGQRSAAASSSVGSAGTAAGQQGSRAQGSRAAGRRAQRRSKLGPAHRRVHSVCTQTCTQCVRQTWAAIVGGVGGRSGK